MNENLSTCRRNDFGLGYAARGKFSGLLNPEVNAESFWVEEIAGGGEVEARS